MKKLIQLMTILIIITAVLIGVYYFSEKEYAKRIDLYRINRTLISLQNEIKELKYDIYEQQYKSKTDTKKMNDNLAALQTSVEEFKDTFLKWKVQNESELNSIKDKFNTIQKKINQTITFSRTETQNSLTALQKETVQTINTLQEKNVKKFKMLQKDIERLNDTYVSEEKLATILQKEFKSSSANYYPVNIDLGALPSGKPNNITRKIPKSVPDTAREILVYAYIATSYVKGGSHSFKIFVKASESREAAFYLYSIASTQQGWSYNSENVWLPMPENRELRFETDGEPLFGNWESGIKIVAYR